MSFYNDKKFDSFYPYWNKYSKECFLIELLNTEIENNKSVLQFCKDNQIQLIIEPGRSLLDQAGITIFRVSHTKQTLDSQDIINVEGNINELSEQWFNTDFLIDPLLIKKKKGIKKEKYSGYVAGNLCLENDFLSWHRVQLDHKPERGDLLIYINTAGYQMDTNECNFQLLPIPKKITAIKDKNWKLSTE